MIGLCMIQSMYKLQAKREALNTPPPLTSFSNYYQFLSIEHPAWVYFEGFLFPNVATAFQAARTTDMALRRQIAENQDTQRFKELARQIKSTEDWAQRRLRVMEQLIRDKFKRNKDLGLKLFATQKRELINGYTQGGDAEMFWGVVDRGGKYQGLNTLGTITTKVREQIQKGEDSEAWVKDQNLEKDSALWPESSLIIEKTDGEADTLLLQKKSYFLIGKAQGNDLSIDHSSVGKNHAAIYFSVNMEVVLVDLNSSQGTKVIRGDNEIQLEALRPESLQDRDVILFGLCNQRFTLFFSYEKVEMQIKRKQEEAQAELERIAKIKQLQQEARLNQKAAAEQRSSIKSLLELKEYSCLYVQNVNRNFTYRDIREAFGEYGKVKNVRINIDQKTGRFMGSVLVYYEAGTNVNDVLTQMRTNPKSYEFRTIAVNAEEAEKIIQTFSNKESQESLKAQKEAQRRKLEIERRQGRGRQSHSRSRSRSRSNRGGWSSSDEN